MIYIYLQEEITPKKLDEGQEVKRIPWEIPIPLESPI